MIATVRLDFVVLDDGTTIDCDLVIVAAGVRPAVECALDTPIHVDRFIQVSDTMETNCPNIYAAGDVTGLSGIWPNAMKQGQIAALNMCGIHRPLRHEKHNELLRARHTLPRSRCCRGRRYRA